MHPATERTGKNQHPSEPRPHPHRIGWVGTTALAMGGSNQSLFLIAALFVGMVLVSDLAERALDFIFRCALLHAEYIVIVLFHIMIIGIQGQKESEGRIV